MAKTKRFTCLICNQGKAQVTKGQLEWKCPNCGAEWSFVHFLVPKEWGEPGQGNK